MQQQGVGCAGAAGARGAVALLSEPVRAWFESAFPEGPTPGQELAWPAIAAGEHVLLIAPTGTGKTLAAFLAVVDRLFRERRVGTLGPGLRCVYVSPLRSLNYDIERNLAAPLEGIARRLELGASPIRVGVRTGDTSAYERRKLRDDPPHILITTPESLSLLLSQEGWRAHWRAVEHLIVDEVHALAPTKRGADLSVSLERVAAQADRDPCRVGLSATCRADDSIGRFLVGPSRRCRIIEAPSPPGTPPPEFAVESLIRPGEAPHRGLSYRRLLRRLRRVIDGHRTTVVFANTRAFAEKITHDLRVVRGSLTAAGWARLSEPSGSRRLAGLAHSGGCEGIDRRSTRSDDSRHRGAPLGAGCPAASGDRGGAEVGRGARGDHQHQPGAGRGHRHGRPDGAGGVAGGRVALRAAGGPLGPPSRSGVARAAAGGDARRADRRGDHGEGGPGRSGRAVADVLGAPGRGLSAARGDGLRGEQAVDACFELLSKAGPMAGLSRADFDACLAFLAGDLAAPPGAYEPEPDAAPRWTSPRIWRRGGWFGVRNGRVARWFRGNVGTIASEESVRVLEEGVAVGTLEASYAERLVPGDRFVLDGRALEVRRLEGSIVHARPGGGEPSLPRWTSDRQSFSSELAVELSAFRAEAARRLGEEGAPAVLGWLADAFELDPGAAAVVVELIDAQEQFSEVPAAGDCWSRRRRRRRSRAGLHVPRPPASRRVRGDGARRGRRRLGRRFGRNLTLAVADLGWSIRLPEGAASAAVDLEPLVSADRLADDVLEGLDRGELLARRFRHVAATALMVLRNPEPGRKVRVGGLNWVSTRLYPLVKAACPDHPLLRQTRREVLDELLDVPAAGRWLASRPTIRFRSLPGLSPFAAAWIEPGSAEALQFESPGDALRRLHARLTAAREGRALRSR